MGFKFVCYLTKMRIPQCHGAPCTISCTHRRWGIRLCNDVHPNIRYAGLEISVVGLQHLGSSLTAQEHASARSSQPAPRLAGWSKFSKFSKTGFLEPLLFCDEPLPLEKNQSNELPCSLRRLPANIHADSSSNSCGTESSLSMQFLDAYSNKLSHRNILHWETSLGVHNEDDDAV